MLNTHFFQLGFVSECSKTNLFSKSMLQMDYLPAEDQLNCISGPCYNFYCQLLSYLK